MKGIRHVPSTVVIGPHGRMLAHGYREIACSDGVLRIYDDHAVVGDHGQRVHVRGKTEIIPKPASPDAWHV